MKYKKNIFKGVDNIRSWFSGRMLVSHTSDPSSIPGGRVLFINLLFIYILSNEPYYFFNNDFINYY